MDIHLNPCLIEQIITITSMDRIYMADVHLSSMIGQKNNDDVDNDMMVSRINLRLMVMAR